MQRGGGGVDAGALKKGSWREETVHFLPGLLGEGTEHLGGGRGGGVQVGESGVTVIFLGKGGSLRRNGRVEAENWKEENVKGKRMTETKLN